MYYVIYLALACMRNYEELKQAVINMAEEEEDPSSGRGRLMFLGVIDQVWAMFRLHVRVWGCCCVYQDERPQLRVE